MACEFCPQVVSGVAKKDDVVRERWGIYPQQVGVVASWSVLGVSERSLIGMPAGLRSQRSLAAMGAFWRSILLGVWMREEEEYCCNKICFCYSICSIQALIYKGIIDFFIHFY